MHDHEDKNLVFIANKIGAIEAKLDLALRVLTHIARHLSGDHSDSEKTKRMTAELANVANQLEAAVTGAKTP